MSKKEIENHEQRDGLDTFDPPPPEPIYDLTASDKRVTSELDRLSAWRTREHGSLYHVRIGIRSPYARESYFHLCGPN
jgi:hypothetical protein